MDDDLELATPSSLSSLGLPERATAGRIEPKVIKASSHPWLKVAVLDGRCPAGGRDPHKVQAMGGGSRTLSQVHTT